MIMCYTVRSVCGWYLIDIMTKCKQASLLRFVQEERLGQASCSVIWICQYPVTCITAHCRARSQPFAIDFGQGCGQCLKTYLWSKKDYTSFSATKRRQFRFNTKSSSFHFSKQEKIVVFWKNVKCVTVYWVPIAKSCIGVNTTNTEDGLTTDMGTPNYT